MYQFRQTLEEIRPFMTKEATEDEIRTLLKKHSKLPEAQHEAFITWLSRLGE